jgi:hypothetical protein
LASILLATLTDLVVRFYGNFTKLVTKPFVLNQYDNVIKIEIREVTNIENINVEKPPILTSKIFFFVENINVQKPQILMLKRLKVGNNVKLIIEY